MNVSDHELNRSLGRMEGELGALKDVLDEIRKDLTTIKSDVAKLKMKEGRRSALESAAVWFVGIISAVGAAVTTALAEHFLK